MALDWIERRQQEPALTDWYLMSVAAEVRRVLAKRPSSIKLEHFKLEFKNKEQSEDPKQSLAALAKQKWLGRMTMPVREVTVSREEYERIYPDHVVRKDGS